MLRGLHLTFIFLFSSVIANVVAEGPRPEPAGQALSAEQSLATIEVPDGYRVELVAAEPLVMDPVAFDWGADGRLWVAEMRDYPNGLTWNGIDDPLNEPGGSIKLLTDTDGDGRYDEATTFLKGLGYPTGVKVWGKGILVTAAPEIFYAEDTDGDGKADKRETWYSGFARSNQQHRVNGLAWGLDNWLHVANGDGGGIILSKQTRDEVDIRGLDLRIDPITRKHEPLSGRTQCGRYRDDWGNWFGCNNSNPIWHYPMLWHRLQRNPDLSPPSPTVSVPKTPGAAPVFPISKTEVRFNQPDRANRFTSVCGPNVYRDDVLGDELQGNIFICEPVHNLVSRQVVKARGATFVSDRHPSEKESEFFASTDNWSRPVSMRTGPDGAIWIADMYRRVIEHPEWIPIDRRKGVEIRAGDNLGRIYRIVPDDESKFVIPKLDQLDNAALAARLDTRNGTVRDFVHQMLLWRKANDTAPAVAALATKAASPAVRVQALCTLDGLGMIEEKIVAAALTDSHPEVIRHAIRLSPGHIDETTLIELVAPHLGNSFVAMEIAGLLGDAETKESQDLLAALLLRHRSDPHVSAIALSSVNRENIANIAEALSLAYFDPSAFRERLSKFGHGLEAPTNDLTRTLAGFAVKWKIPEAGKAYVDALVRTADSEGNLPKAWRVSLLLGLLQSAPDLDAVSSNPTAQKVIRDLIKKTRTLSLSSNAPTWSRLEAIQLLGASAVYSEELDLPLLTSLLQTKNDPALREAASSTLSKTRGIATATSLIGQWEHLPPADRSKVQNLLLGRGEWAEALLSAVEAGTIPPAQIDAAGRSRLMESENEEFKKRAEKLFAAASNPNREKVLSEWKSIIDMKGDAGRGKQAFATACIACHMAEGQGNAIGPDLAAITDRSRNALLVAILDPNRAVEDKFVTWNVKTNAGASHLGLVANESANDFTLRGPDGSELKILRSDIESMSSVGISLMPEGLEATMTKPQMADLITYVASLGAPAKPEPVLSARVGPGGKGIVELRASKCRFAGDKIEYMPDFDALGWWTSEKDRAGWTVVLDRPGTYRVEWNYSVSPESAGNSWQLVVNGKKALGGEVKSTGSWETFKTQRLGEIKLPAADNSFVIRSEGPVDQALLDLRSVKLIPVGE